jgi:hypothetical protein
MWQYKKVEHYQVEKYRKEEFVKLYEEREMTSLRKDVL